MYLPSREDWRVISAIRGLALLYTGGWDVGLQYPAALGVEGSGSVLAVGADVTGIGVGDQVLAHEAPFPKGSGFWAERTLITAEHAMEFGRDVVAVAGSVTSALSEVPLQLIREGATLIRDVEDLLRRKMTFRQALEGADFPIMARQRLKVVQRELFEQLDSLAIL